MHGSYEARTSPHAAYNFRQVWLKRLSSYYERMRKSYLSGYASFPLHQHHSMPQSLYWLVSGHRIATIPVCRIQHDHDDNTDTTMISYDRVSRPTLSKILVLSDLVGSKEVETIVVKKPSRNSTTMSQRNCTLSQEKNSSQAGR